MATLYQAVLEDYVLGAMSLVTLAGIAILGALSYVILFTGTRSRHLPPGPPTLPIIGNLHQIPKDKAYLRFDKWAKEYGPIYSLKLASQTYIVLTDRRLVKELMDKRSSITSDRPQNYIMDQMVYDGDDIILMQASNPHWKIARRFMHQNFMAKMVENDHMPLLNAETVQMLRDMLVEPESFMDHSRTFWKQLYDECRLVLNPIGDRLKSADPPIAYGIRTPHRQISHMVEINKVTQNLTSLLSPGTLPPVDLFPFILYLPHQLFGHWRDKVTSTRKIMNDLYSSYLSYVAKRQKERGPTESFGDRLIQQQGQLNWTWHGLYFMAGLMMEAGSDTTSGVINNFLLLMTASPTAYKKAQQQIDAHISEDRSPTWEDFKELPAVNALVKETMRIRPTSPIAFPHALSEDIWIDGMLLPRGSVIIANVLGLQHDEKRFPNPESFNPDNYKDKPELADVYANASDPEQRDHYAYGTGRRICVGIHLAERALFVAMAKILWAFDILPATDEAGKTIQNDLDWESGTEGSIIVLPKPFACELRPRSEKRKKTIFREFAEAERTFFPKYAAPEK